MIGASHHGEGRAPYLDLGVHDDHAEPPVLRQTLDLQLDVPFPERHHLVGRPAQQAGPLASTKPRRRT